MKLATIIWLHPSYKSWGRMILKILSSVSHGILCTTISHGCKCCCQCTVGSQQYFISIGMYENISTIIRHDIYLKCESFVFVGKMEGSTFEEKMKAYDHGYFIVLTVWRSAVSIYIGFVKVWLGLKVLRGFFRSTDSTLKFHLDEYYS